MKHTKSRNNRIRLRSRMSRRLSKKSKIIKKGGGKFNFELKLVNKPEPGMIITDLLTNKKYFFSNAVQHYAQHIYWLATNKQLNDNEEYLTKNLTRFSTDNENIIKLLKENKTFVSEFL
jgi:hypothetical protein